MRGGNMATEPRLESLLDNPLGLVRTSSKDSSLQLPPLQDLTPPRLSIRPLPLEPNTAANGQAHVKTSKLSPAHAGSHKKRRPDIRDTHTTQRDGTLHDAGEEAKKEASGSHRGSVVSIGGLLPTADAFFESDDIGGEATATSTSRKRQKLVPASAPATSFVQLPRPPQRKEQPAQVPNIAALNELKTQLPNADHFPPIALLASDEENGEESGAPLDVSVKVPGANQKALHQFVSERKRSCKPRRKWTEQETEDLLQGVALHGVGSWKKILKDSRFKFNARSSIDLKDRFRTCCPYEYGIQMRSKSPKPANSKDDSERSGSKSSTSHTPGSLTSLGEQLTSSSPPVPQSSQPCTSSTPPPTSCSLRSHRVNPEDLARLGIEGPFPKSKRRERRAFTEEEDAQILKGYMAYGPLWTRIREDRSLNLHSRRAIDLRDRFRNRFPDKYAEAGFKMRPKDWPKPPARSSKRDERLQAAQVSSSSPPSEETDTAVAKVHEELEVQPEPVIQDEDPAMPSISSLVDWDNNTLPPFLTQANHGGGDSSDLQRLLLDKIQPLLTYDPNRPSSHSTTAKPSRANPMEKSTTTGLRHDPPSVTGKHSMTDTAITSDNPKLPLAFHLPPPLDLLPLDFDPPPTLSTTSTSSSLTTSTTTATIAPSLSLLLPPAFHFPRPTWALSTHKRISSNKTLDAFGSNSSNSTAGGSSANKYNHTFVVPVSVSVPTSAQPLPPPPPPPQPPALMWEDMATHPMFDIDTDPPALPPPLPLPSLSNITTATASSTTPVLRRDGTL